MPGQKKKQTGRRTGTAVPLGLRKKAGRPSLGGISKAGRSLGTPNKRKSGQGSGMTPLSLVLNAIWKDLKASYGHANSNIDLKA